LLRAQREALVQASRSRPSSIQISARPANPSEHDSTQTVINANRLCASPGLAFGRSAEPIFFPAQECANAKLMTNRFTIDPNTLDNQKPLLEQLNHALALAETEGVNGLLHVLACDSCLTRYGNGDDWTIYEVTDTCPTCAVTQVLVYRVRGWHCCHPLP
jgi:hypothetical protein